MYFVNFFIAWRLKHGRRRGSLVSLIAFISTFSVALGMIVLIVGLSAMNGFERELRLRILAVIPHAQFSGPSGKLTDWIQVQQALAKSKHVQSATPYVSFTGLLENKRQLSAVLVKGVSASAEEKHSTLFNYVSSGGWQYFKDNRNSIIIGAGLAARLRVRPGQSVSLLIPPQGQNHLKSPRRVRMRVAGILQLNGTLGNRFALISIKSAQDYAELGDSVTGIDIEVDDPFHAYQYASAAARNSPFPVTVNSWESEYGYMYRDIQMIRSIMYLSMILVITISCFSIISTLIIAVKDKQQDIAILKTLGASDRQIKRIFLCYGSLVGGGGSVLGALLGSIIAVNLSALFAFIEARIGHKFLDGNIYFIDFMPSELHLSDVAFVFVTTFVLSLLASYYPAKRACQVDPAARLRHH